MSMGLRSPNMAIARRFDAKIVILIGFAMLSCCVAHGASRGHLFKAGAGRRSLTQDTVKRKIFDVTAFGAKTEEQMKKPDEANKDEKNGESDNNILPVLPGGGTPLPGGGFALDSSKLVPWSTDDDDEKVDSTSTDSNPIEDNDSAFIQTWVAACRGNYSGPAKVVIPKGTFLTGPVVFQGPCNSSKEPIIVEVQGTLKASTDLSLYASPEWFSFEIIDGLILTGDGVFDGQGESSWKGKIECKDKPDCPQSPSSLKFTKVNNTIVEGITSLNSKFFHAHVYDCNNITFNNIHINAPGESPNTDGIHISSSTHVQVINSLIGTGDDCVSIGQGTQNITVHNVTCGPGHGISIGSLGKYDDEESVSGVVVTNCTFKNTTNGARIKTWEGKNPGKATAIIYEDIVMDNVKNPIVIDQHYGNKKDKATDSKPSKWKISDVHFRNIRGTSQRNVAVSLLCSRLNPCDGIELADINLAYSGESTKNADIIAECSNAKIAPKGVQNPPAPACH